MDFLTIRYALGVLFYIFGPLLAFAQTKDIEVVANETQEFVSFWGVNRSDFTHEIELKIQVENLLGYNGPITKLVPSKDSLVMVRLGIHKGKLWQYQTKYTYKSKPTELELQVYRTRRKEELYSILQVDSNPVILFYKEGCSRSSYAKQQLDRKRINHTFINTSTDFQSRKMLNELVKIDNPDFKRFVYPVILTERELVYNIKDLKSYMKKLVAANK